MAGSYGYNRAIFEENYNRSMVYKNAYNKAYDKAVAPSSEETKRRLTEDSGKEDVRKGKLKRSFSVAQDTPEYEEEFNSEFFCPQQNLFPSPCLPDFSMPDMEYTIDYSEKLNPPQEPDTIINSVEELSHYLDSFSTPTPLLPQDKATSINFDAVNDLFDVYEIIQPTSLNQSRFYQPLFFSTRVPQEPGIMQEAPIHFVADRII